MAKPIKTHHLDRRAARLMEDTAEGHPDDLLTTAELAEWLGTSRQWLEIGRCKSGNYGPPFIRLGPKQIRYRRCDVVRWLEERAYWRTTEYPAS
ncbi:MAG TPA: hypothetical protein VMX97_08530 [Hyphomicrobiaceae bacterium]|nr:hypothetical protein [Hyphomicrobiaceae bacterium]